MKRKCYDKLIASLHRVKHTVAIVGGSRYSSAVRWEARRDSIRVECAIGERRGAQKAPACDEQGRTAIPYDGWMSKEQLQVIHELLCRCVICTRRRRLHDEKLVGNGTQMRRLVDQRHIGKAVEQGKRQRIAWFHQVHC